MINSIFQEGSQVIIAKRIKNHLNKIQDYLSPKTLNSNRAAGDAIEEIICDHFQEFAAEYCQEYSSNFARRAMADLAFTDKFGNYHVVDVKTHREDTKFNMPNLTSVERLSRFYEDDTNFFSILVIKYKLEGNSLHITDVFFNPIEFLDWECLTIGALGWGQIQIANSNNILVDAKQSRISWMIQLCDILLAFYPKEISKIGDRISRFESVREFWIAKRTS